MNILVTGAAGLVGSHLCQKLVMDGYQVTGLIHNRQSSLTESLLQIKNFRIYVGDIRDTKMINKLLKDNRIRTVFHMAAHIPSSREKDYDRVNVLGVSDLLNLSRSNNVEEFIYASTMSVYSVPPDYLPVDEVHPTRPPDMYGATKLMGELYCNCYSRFMRATILRYAGVYGIGSNVRAVFNFLQAALTNQPLSILGNGAQSSEFVHVDDVVAGTYLAWKKKSAEVYNIGSGEETTIADLAHQIVDITNSRSEIVLSSKETDRPFRFVSDISKARRELDYTPMNLSQGLSMYCEDLRNGR